MFRRLAAIFMLLSVLMPWPGFAQSTEVLDAFYKACGKRRSDQIKIYFSALKEVQSCSQRLDRKVSSHSKELLAAVKQALGASKVYREADIQMPAIDKRLKEINTSNSSLLEHARLSLSDDEGYQLYIKKAYPNTIDDGWLAQYFEARKLLSAQTKILVELEKETSLIQQKLERKFSQILGVKSKEIELFFRPYKLDRGSNPQLVSYEVMSDSITFWIRDQKVSSVASGWQVRNTRGARPLITRSGNPTFVDWALVDAGYDEKQVLLASDAQLRVIAQEIVDGPLSRALMIDGEIGGTSKPQTFGVAPYMAEVLNPQAEEVLRERKHLQGPVQYCADPLLLGFEKVRVIPEPEVTDSEPGT